MNHPVTGGRITVTDTQVAVFAKSGWVLTDTPEPATEPEPETEPEVDAAEPPPAEPKKPSRTSGRTKKEES
jgi:hypothetical protein